MKTDDPFALMKELTQTFEQGNSSNFDLNGGGFKSLINKTSNPTELYQRNFSSENPGASLHRKDASSFPSTFKVSDDLQKMREKGGLGGLANIFGDSSKKTKTNDISLDSGAITDLMKNQTIFRPSNQPS